MQFFKCEVHLPSSGHPPDVKLSPAALRSKPFGLPGLAAGVADVAVGLGHVGHFHVRCVPLERLAGELQRHRAQQDHFAEWPGVVERRLGLTAVGAEYRVDELAVVMLRLGLGSGDALEFLSGQTDRKFDSAYMCVAVRE